MSRSSWSIPVAVLLVAFVVRGLAFHHGLPQRYVADTHVVRAALGMASDGDLAPPARKYTSYPYLLPWLLLPAYAVLYVGGKATGAWSSAAEFGAHVIDDPTPVYLVARGLELLFGMLAVVLAWRIGKRVADERVGWIAAWLVATSFLLVHLGKCARPWVPLAALVLFAAERALAWKERPTWWNAAWMGIAAGACIACHQAGATAVLFAAGAVLSRLRVDRGRAIGAGLVAAVAFTAIAIGVGFPYILRGGSANVAVADNVEGKVDLGGQSFDPGQIGFHRAADIALGFFAAEPALVLLLFIGLVPAVRELRRRGLLLTLGLYPAIVVPLYVFYAGSHVRYLATAVPSLALFAAFGVLASWKNTPGRIIALVLLAAPLVQALRYDVVLARTDTRSEFLERVAARVPENARVAVDFWGPPLRVSADARAILEAHGQALSRAELRQADGSAPRTPERPPYTVIPLERFYASTLLEPASWRGDGDKSVDALFDELGVEWVITVERTPAAPRPSKLRELLARRGEKVDELLPYPPDHPPGEAHLPMDPARAATAIWVVDRPGPALQLWKLKR